MTDQTRREFLQSVTQSAIVLAAAGAVPAAAAAAQAGGAEAAVAASALRQVFDAPPPSARPMTRWWWFGGAVTPAEITRELTFMRDAGLRGAEIQPVYPVTVDDQPAGVRHVRCFTAEWFALLRHASREARRLGLQIDLTLGSGWPYGGPFVPPALGARRLRLHAKDVAGPRSLEWDVASLMGEDDRLVALLLVPVGDDGAPQLGAVRRLEAGSTPGVRVDVPNGRWRLMLVVDAPTGMLVLRPTYGMEGLVIDHHNRHAVGLFLRAAGDRVLDAIGTESGPAFHSVFCDSLEVFGADWTDRLLAEFERRRGYSLVPYLPALFDDAGPLTPHVRYDYHLTLSDLIIDEFFRPLAEWSARRGVKARVQAHGAMGDVMRGYGLADVPEGENIFLGDRYQVNLKHRRLASSAAHIYGKPVASAETYTWLRMPTFTTTLEMMKAASDSVFLDGINQIVNHGYSYSPPEAGEPGWAFYASTEINHTQTWWRHYPLLARYVQRVSAMLQQGVSVNPVLVYLPMADVYAKHGVGGLHLDVEVQAHLDPALLDALRRAGYDFDVVNDHALAELMRIDGDTLCGGTGRYKVVVVNDVRMMPPESAERIAAFVRAGGHLVVVGRMPEEAPGIGDREARTASLRRVLSGLWSGGWPDAAKGVAPKASAAFVADTAAALARLAKVLTPDVRLVGKDVEAALPHVGFTHRRIGRVDCYFVANVSPDRRHLRAEFAVGHRAPQRWDPETSRAIDPPFEYATRSGAQVTSVELPLAPFESCFIVFGGDRRAPDLLSADERGQWDIVREGTRTRISGLLPQVGDYELTHAHGRIRRVTVRALPEAAEVKGPWRLSLGTRPAVQLASLQPWAEIPEGKGFSGWGVYEAEVDVPDLGDDTEWFVDLGEVHETAHVALNGRDLGPAWKGTRRVACGTAMARGRNRLRVEVANLWIHHLLAHPPGDPARRLRGVGADPELAETAGIRWGTYGEVPPEQVPASGLLGPVTLVPLKRVNVK